jgi:hypothetical protein
MKHLADKTHQSVSVIDINKHNDIFIKGNIDKNILKKEIF